MFLKTYNTEFDEIMVTSTDQNGRSLGIEDRVNLTLLINKLKWRNILCNQEQQNMLKDMDFYHLRKNIYIYKILDKGLDASKKVVHKTGEYLGNKIPYVITKSGDNVEKQEAVGEIIIPPEKREGILKILRKVL